MLDYRPVGKSRWLVVVAGHRDVEDCSTHNDEYRKQGEYCFRDRLAIGRRQNSISRSSLGLLASAQNQAKGYNKCLKNYCGNSSKLYNLA